MSGEEQNKQNDEYKLQLVTDIVTAYVSHNSVPANDLPEVIRTVHRTLEGLSRDQEKVEKEDLKPAVPIKKSVSDDYIVCLEDGKKLKMLKRYLRTRYDMTPEDYREKWGLPADYPMVAPSYAAKRSAFAKKIGLGQGGRRGGRKS
ncbi:MAG: MucR family transcriptional regulator [Rhodothalassiaceae bacterium]